VRLIHDEVGFNYRMTDIAAAVGLAQLEQLDGFLDWKRAQAAKYRSAFADDPGIIAQPGTGYARRAAG
jgi:perosamine synthetase